LLIFYVFPMADVLLCCLASTQRRPPPEPTTLKWHDAGPLVRNKGFNSSVAFLSPFHRLPAAAKTGAWCSPPCPVRDKVWAEGTNGAGLYLAFRTDAPQIWLNATLIKAAKEGTDCSAVCGSGLDMYAYDEDGAARDNSSSGWRWVDTTKSSFGQNFKYAGQYINRAMVDIPTTSWRYGRNISYRIHMPIYNGLTAARIGVGANFSLSASPEDVAHAPIVWYGTSIVNGHVASRPGMIFSNALTRALGRSIINLGFGGNGEMEDSVGVLITQMKHAAMVVIDCNWNMSPEQILTNTIPIILQLRHSVRGTTAPHSTSTILSHDLF
jgi:hypothetical protein